MDIVWQRRFHFTQAPIFRYGCIPSCLFWCITPCHSQRWSCKIGRGISSIDAHGCGPACWHQVGIAMARYLAWMEQQSTDTVGPRWTATLVCHMHRSSVEICILCCNFTSRTMDPQDSRMEHERATETRATGLHLGNSAANIFDLERLWQLDCRGCCTWTLDANVAGFCSFHLA